MKVTKLIQQIGKCRDLIETKDTKEILKNIYLFDVVVESTKIQLNKLIKNENHKLDFTYQDLADLSEEIFNFIKNYQTKMTFNSFLKELKKLEVINDNVLNSFTSKQADLMYLDRKLREAYKILGYNALTLWVLTEAEKQKELDWQITEAIRSFLC